MPGQDFIEQEQFREENIDIKAYIIKFLYKWYWFVISVVLFMALGYLYAKTRVPQYRVGTTLLIKDESSLMDPEAVLKSEFSSSNFFNDYKLQNEIQVLRSYGLTKQAFRKLDFSVDYFEEGYFRDTELYSRKPFTVVYDSAHVQTLGAPFRVKFLDGERFMISAEAEEFSLYDYRDDHIRGKRMNLLFEDTLRFGEKVTTDNFSFCLKREIAQPESNNEYYFRFRSLNSLIFQYSNFDIQEIDYSSVVKLTQETANVEKSLLFLKSLTTTYLNRGVSKKNSIAQNTIQFIDDQLRDISDSLQMAEERLERFRSNNQVMNIDYQAQQEYTRMEAFQEQKANILLKLKYYRYLKDYMNENKDFQDIIAPSAMGVSDPLLNDLILELTRLNSEKVEVMVNSKKDNPYLESIRQRIENQKNTLEENVENLIGQAEISLADIDGRIEKLSDKLSGLPQTQRQLISFERAFQLHDELYTFLLKKRSEMEIAKASNVPEHEMLDVPRLLSQGPVAPNKRIIYILSFILGLGVPAMLILLMDYFNDKVTDLDELERISPYPLLGNIPHKKISGNLVMKDGTPVMSEAFRSLRNNFEFLTGDVKHPVILISSSMMGEGKSFVSLNLAHSFALYEKNVVLLSFDLRRPTLTKEMQVSKSVGLSNYLSGHADIGEIINPSKVDHLDLIPSGPIPPNPTELIASPKCQELFAFLKEKYDYVIIDSPPLGILTDALMLSRHSDVNLYVVRQNYTRKRLFAGIMKNVRQKDFTNLHLIVNDIKKKTHPYSYHYNYGYGYAYKYPNES